VDALSSIASKAQSSGDFSYFGYHAFRSAFFAAQGAAGLVASALSKPSSPGGWLDLTKRREPTQAQLNQGVIGGSADETPLDAFSRYAKAGEKLYCEAMAMFERDHANIEMGLYPRPWDMEEPNHRQFDPRFILNRGRRFVREAVGTLGRRDKGSPDNLWFDSSLYPKYYMNTWHYQSDGWMSSESAKVRRPTE
jgi:hypothetical protein